MDALIDRALASPAMRRLSAQIRREQRRLRALVDDDAWAAYMRVEGASNERLVEALDAVAKGASRAREPGGRP